MARLDNGGVDLGPTPLGAAVRSPQKQRRAFAWIGALGADGGARSYNPGSGAGGGSTASPLNVGGLGGGRKGRKARRKR